MPATSHARGDAAPLGLSLPVSDLGSHSLFISTQEVKLGGVELKVIEVHTALGLIKSLNIIILLGN